MRQIPILRAVPGMVLARDITSAKGFLLLKAGTALNETYINKLKQFGVMRLLVEDERTDDICVPPALSFEIQRKALESAERSLSGGVPDQTTAGRVEGCIESIVAELTADPKMMVHLMDMYAAQDAMFYHSVNTTVLSLTVALSLGANPQRLKNIGIAAMLHDVGLTRVPEEILAHGLDMTDEERAEFRKHPLHGHRILERIPGVTTVAARAVHQHHEWVNGGGYPAGLPDDKISDVAKIVSVADYYDAHVSPQWYRRPQLPHEVMESVTEMAGTRFDHQVVHVFFKRVAVYPVGTSVELDGGCVGIVARVHPQVPTRPVVRVVRDAGGAPVARPYDLDLLEETSIQVTAVVDL